MCVCSYGWLYFFLLPLLRPRGVGIPRGGRRLAWVSYIHSLCTNLLAALSPARRKAHSHRRPKAKHTHAHTHAKKRNSAREKLQLLRKPENNDHTLLSHQGFSRLAL